MIGPDGKIRSGRPKPPADENNKMRHLTVGDKVKIDEKFHAGLDKIIEDCDMAQAGYTEAVKKLKMMNDVLFNYIHEAYPETVGLNLNYNQKAKEVLVLGTKPIAGTKII
jgi:hypothetical protein